MSADFLSSDFIAENELPPLLAAAESRGLTVLTLVVSPCLFDATSLVEFQSVNDPRTPLTSLNRNEQEEVLVRLAQTIRWLFSQ